MGNRSDSLTRWSGRSLAACVVALFLGLTGQEALAQDPPSICAPAVGRLVSLQGSVELQRAGGKDWEAVKRLDTSICAGDRLRTGAMSRALLFVQPETIVRVDQNTAITLHQADEVIEIEFFASELAAQMTGSQSRGAGYFITRFPKKFKVVTPHMNAAVEGTEFMVELGPDTTKLTVIEGKVSSESVATRDTQLVTAGQSIASGAAGPSAIVAVIRPQDAVQWVLRYPPLSDGPSSSTRAEELLQAGSVNEALASIDQTLAGDPGNADALALRSVIQIAKNDKASAVESAYRATNANDRSYRAWIAHSYAQQAQLDLKSALESANKALALQPGSPLALSRIAEIRLSLGDTEGAEEAAQAAIASDAADSNAFTMLGFVHLAQIETSAAQADFSAAIEHDSFSALPRLGFGLALIRQGKLVKGREQLEIAVALDPANSLLRSYAGKAYYEENVAERDKLAKSQFQLAQQLDPQDPTPWFYDAFLDQSMNRPVEALQALQLSIEKNDNRAVYRSRLLVDSDAAARSASVAEVYDNLGFDKLAIVESAKALSEDSGNYSAHEQLASAYANIPRHDIARVSEALQAQIRQPVSLATVGPLLSTDNLVVSRDAGPARPGVNEFNALFNQDGMRIQFDGMAGNLDTYGDQFIASALKDKLSFTLSQVHYETDGFVPNDAAEKDILDVIVHGQVTPQMSMQVDLKSADFSAGQTFYPFSEFPTPTTITERSDTLRVSGHHEVDAGNNWIWSVAAENRDRAVRSFPDGGLFTKSDATPYAVEVQHSRRGRAFQLIAGAGYVDETEHFPDQSVEIRTQSANAYAYGQWSATQRSLEIYAGLAGEWFKARTQAPFTSDTDPVDRNRISPKLGIIWSPSPGTTVRVAALSSVRRPFIRSQTIEPTQVAGFNQFFTGFEQVYGDFIGTVSDRIGVAIDQTFARDTFAGIEATWRRLEVPSSVTDEDFTWREQTAHAYLYRTLSVDGHHWLSTDWQAAISAELEYEKIERPQILTGSEGIVDLETGMVPFGIRFYSSGGTTIRLATTYVNQEGVFSIDEESPIVDKHDEAWITDVSIEHRLPRRRGLVTFGVRNMFDVSIDLLEIDPVNPLIATKRFVFGRFSFEF